MALNYTQLIIGDDYLAANGRAIQVTFAAITGLTVGSCTVKLGFEDDNGNTMEVTGAAGSVVDAGGGNWTASVNITKTDSAALVAGFYDYSLEIAESGTEITVDYNADRQNRVEWKEKKVT